VERTRTKANSEATKKPFNTTNTSAATTRVAEIAISIIGASAVRGRGGCDGRMCGVMDIVDHAGGSTRSH